MADLHIKNHFVPECYLKRWEDSDKKLCVYRTLVSHKNVLIWKKSSVSAVAYHIHLYTQMISGDESDELEKWLDKEYESPANIVLQKAVLEKRLTPDDWSILIRFLAAQDVRTPTRLFEHLKRYNKMFPEILQDSLSKLEEKIKKKEIGNYSGPKTLDSKYAQVPLKITTKAIPGKKFGVLKAESYAGRSTWIYSIKYLLKNTEKILHTHKWTIVKPAKGYNWFTSDNPVIKLNYTDLNSYDLKGGWGKNKGNIIFPIGPEHAMFVQIGDKPMPKGTRLSVSQTKFLKKIIAENSNRMIFSNYYDHEIQSMRQRDIDSIRYRDEKKAIEEWHEKNAKLEMEYSKNNKNA